MRQANINHKRITAIVRQELHSAIYKAREYEQEERQHPGSDLARILKSGVIPGIELDKVGDICREFVTINDEFLSLVGYDGNLGGFLADYFGSDYKPKEGEPLKFRFLDGYLINPTVTNKKN